MREILFRGKEIETNKWFYGAFVPDALEGSNDLVSWGFIRNYNHETHKMQTIEVDRETIGQFTGLTDKNGKKIFEGDILKVKTGWKKSKGYKAISGGVFDGITEKKGETYWTVEHKTYACEMGFMTFGIDRRFHKPLTSSRLFNADAEVAGNIYDNPELLSEKVATV